jgi:hypothetical protein
MSDRNRKLRLTVWRPNVGLFTAGIAALSLSAALGATVPDATTSPNLHLLWEWLISVSGVVGFGLGIAGLARRVPLVEIESDWNVVYDQLRNRTDRFIAEVLDPAANVLRNQHPEMRGSWRDYIDKVPVPFVDGGSLLRWDAKLKQYSDDSREFYQIARAAEGIKEGAEYRRFAVRTYDRFFRARASVPGFKEWMAQEEVQWGAEPLLVVLAYMEIARAALVHGGKGAVHLGFWSLADEWHHRNILRLPKSGGDAT